MTKQKLESIFSKSLKVRLDLWYLKLQVNPFAYTKSPADYIVIAENNIYLIECKQVDLRKNNKNRYTFDRLTQENDLLNFQCDKGYSYVCILFLERRLNISHCYLIDIEYYVQIKNIINKKSLTLKDMKENFEGCKVDILKGGILDLYQYIK